MKIVVIHNISSNDDRYISLRPDNAVLRNNDDFYLPNFSNEIICGCGIVVRISRLAKCIAPKFASRCYDSVTAGVTFIARDVMQKALLESRPTDEAYSFDRSTAIGTQWLTPEQISSEGTLAMTIGDSRQDYTYNFLKEHIDQSVAFASNKLTLKTGDLVFIANDIAKQIKLDDNIIVTFNEIESLNFNIK